MLVWHHSRMSLTPHLRCRGEWEERHVLVRAVERRGGVGRRGLLGIVELATFLGEELRGCVTLADLIFMKLLDAGADCRVELVLAESSRSRMILLSVRRFEALD